jgi:hypothetical protein
MPDIAAVMKDGRVAVMEVKVRLTNAESGELDRLLDEFFRAQLMTPWPGQAQTSTAAEPGKVLPQADPTEVFPRWWELFAFVLSHSVRERVYQPMYEELKEDYIRAAELWDGWFSRRWLTFCFGLRSLKLVAQCLWEAAGSKGRKALYGLLIAIIGSQGAEAIRERIAAWIGRLP